MSKYREQAAFAPFGQDIKDARKALGLSRQKLAEAINIDPRYLANIENSGSLPSLAIFYELVVYCQIPVERYFTPEALERKTPQRERMDLKLSTCPESFLPVVEATVDSLNQLAKPGKR
jgi:transcriptional regulator with XRE-family HTH domain